MIKSRIPALYFLIPLLLWSLASQSQIITNQAALRQASHDRTAQHAALQQMIRTMARQKGWPLTLRDKRGRLAYLLGINAKGFPVYVTTTENIISAATIGTSKLWPGGSTGLALNGSTAALKGKIAVWDEGIVRPTHVELVGRVTQVDNPSALSDHSTHVAGTMIAAGVNPVAKGMAFAAQQLLAYDFNNDVAEMMAAAANGLLVSNHSYATIAGWYLNDSNNEWQFYGNPGDTVDIRFGQYDSETQVWDSIAYNAPQYLIFKAAGNNRSGSNGPAVGQTYYRMDASGNFYNAGARPANISSNNGFDIIATYGCAKNIVTVGAVNPIPGGYTKSSDVVLTDFSSWGPTADGRIKPDVVADGLNVLSSISTADNAYDIYSGTSMATPASAGSGFLLQEYFYKKYGRFMRSATLKGLLIHTASEAGPAPGPDYQYGWGLLNIQQAAAVITADSAGQFINENNLVNGSHDSDSLNIVASGKIPVVATICWTDPPAVPSGETGVDTTHKLVNDLDLTITDSVTGQLYQTWVLNPYNPSAAATRGNNNRDNVEKVPVDSLVAGRTYIIKVKHKGTLARGSQAYSLLVSGGGGVAYCVSSSGGGSGTKVNNVTLSNLNNTNSSGCKSYSDFTGLTAARMPVGQTLPISISYLNCTGSSSSTNIAVYIDFNNNGSFSDPGELVLQNSVLLASGATAATFSGNITIPATAAPGSYSRMRIVAEDGAALATPAPCGAYGSGETQDYRVVFVNPTNDVGISSLEYPTLTTCANDSQIVAVRIHNYGTTPQTSVPVTTTVLKGGTVIATLSATCTDSLYGQSDVVFTYNTSIPTQAGTSYTFISKTALSGDADTSNDRNTTTLTVSAVDGTLSGTATICSSSSNVATLKANTSGDDIAFWYSGADSTVPVAAGSPATTGDIPANKTYYLAANDLQGKAGPPNKLAYAGGAGAYFRLKGNFLQFTTSVPLTIESAKMYIGYPGEITFTLATLVSFSSSTFSYIPLYSSTVNVYATRQAPSAAQQTNVTAGDNTDTGAVFYLNIPVPTPGNYILLMDCSDSTNAFLNLYPSETTAVPYPITMPGVISITGNDMHYNPTSISDSVNYYKRFYYPFYNMGIRVSGCPGPRTAVVATTPVAPQITLSGNILSSNVAEGNQWVLSGTPIPGATNQTDTISSPGVYQTFVSDTATGCVLQSNQIPYANGTIGLKVSPNPNPGAFVLQFYVATAANTSIELFNTLGQKVYEADYPNFSGYFDQTIDAENLGSGMYVLKLIHGSNTYVQKIIVKK